MSTDRPPVHPREGDFRPGAVCAEGPYGHAESMHAISSPASDRLPGYDPGTHWDEAFAGPGELRPAYRQVIEALDDVDLARLRRTIALAGAMRGMAFRGSRGPQEFPLDPVPRILDAAEHRLLETGLAQRAAALDAFLTDIYTDGRIVAAGVVPQRVIDSADALDPDVPAIAAAQGGVRAGVGGFDIVRGGDGVLRVLEDNLRVPSGAAYALAAREIVDERRVLPVPSTRSPIDIAELLGDTLREAAPEGIDEPGVAVLSDGASNSAWWEHRSLAKTLGVPVVTPHDLEQRDGRLWMRIRGTDRLTPLHVLYRRTDEGRLRDPATGNLTWLGDALLEPLRQGTLGVVNAFGTGIADDKLVHAYVEEMIRFYLGQEPIVASVHTYDPCDAESRAAIIDRIGEMVVKPRNGSGGSGVIVCPHATSEDREMAAQLISVRPEAFVVQETIALSTHPTAIGDRLEPRHVDLRAFTYGGRMLAGGLTRVALDAGALVVNSSMNGGGKDTWILS